MAGASMAGNKACAGAAGASKAAWSSSTAAFRRPAWTMDLNLVKPRGSRVALLSAEAWRRSAMARMVCTRRGPVWCESVHASNKESICGGSSAVRPLRTPTCSKISMETALSASSSSAVSNRNAKARSDPGDGPFVRKCTSKFASSACASCGAASSAFFDLRGCLRGADSSSRRGESAFLPTSRPQRTTALRKSSWTWTLNRRKALFGPAA
mmetsp:Transcript_10611/g.37364  ORF Transcript_10611/g.37364 Transcript_10611/m.37364 type:complete len:211 (+) Transcript_10611:1055-1687(+)